LQLVAFRFIEWIAASIAIAYRYRFSRGFFDLSHHATIN
jgi:hypothetical protein